LEYGTGPVPYDEGQREEPVSLYPASLVATLALLNALVKTGDYFPIVTLRFGWVYGPGGPPDFFVPSLIAHCLEGRRFDMTAGSQRRDLVYVDDVVDACIRAGRTNIPTGSIINIGGGCSLSLREVAELIANKMDAVHCLKVAALPQRSGDVGDAYCDNTRARDLLGWAPATSLDDGFEKTIEWYTRQEGR
jgi:nucleoside-diphosphate-sugar epimerase